MTVKRKGLQKLSEVYRSAAALLWSEGQKILRAWGTAFQYCVGPRVIQLSMCESIQRLNANFGILDSAEILLHAIFDKMEEKESHFGHGVYWFTGPLDTREQCMEVINTRVLILCFAADIVEDEEVENSLLIP